MLHSHFYRPANLMIRTNSKRSLRPLSFLSRTGNVSYAFLFLALTSISILIFSPENWQLKFIALLSANHLKPQFSPLHASFLAIRSILHSNSSRGRVCGPALLMLRHHPDHRHSVPRIAIWQFLQSLSIRSFISLSTNFL